MTTTRNSENRWVDQVERKQYYEPQKQETRELQTSIKENTGRDYIEKFIKKNTKLFLKQFLLDLTLHLCIQTVQIVSNSQVNLFLKKYNKKSFKIWVQKLHMK